MKKISFKSAFVLGTVALASGLACAQTSSVQLYGIVDVAFATPPTKAPPPTKAAR